MAEGFRFMPLGLVRTENISAQCMDYLGADINASVHAPGRNGRATQRCHYSPDGKRG